MKYIRHISVIYPDAINNNGTEIILLKIINNYIFNTDIKI